MKKLVIICSVILMIFTSVSCSNTKSNTADKAITIGLMPSVDAIPLILADNNGYYNDQGIKVDFQVFKSAKDRDAAFQAGSLDGIIGDQVAICLYQNAGFDVKAVSRTDCDFMLIAGKDSGIKTINDLVGKSIAISEKTVIEYTLDQMLAKASIDINSITKTAIPAIPTRLEMLRNNKVSAALLPEPFATLAIKDGGILLGKASDMGLNPTVLAFTQKSLDDKGNEIAKLLNAYDKAVDYANNTPISDYEDIVINTVGYPEEMKGQIVLPKFHKSSLPSDEELQQTIDWANSINLLQKQISPQMLSANVNK